MGKCICCGKSGLLLKTNDMGYCLSCVTSKYRRLMEESPKDAVELQRVTEMLEKRQEDANDVLDRIKAAKQELIKLSNELVVAREDVELESFALYRPKYALQNSEAYKERLAACRDNQKHMIKMGTAAICKDTWVVNGNVKEGQKMSKDEMKLFLRAFNNECDMAVSAVRFSNFDRCKNRIQKSFDAINALGRVSQIHISSQYLALKVQELELAYEYQCKKEEEKEKMRELREQQREEAALKKEIEAARKEAEKEKAHYRLALEKLRAQEERAQSEEQKQEISKKREEILGYVEDLERKMEDIDYRIKNQRAGYVYIISNIGSFGEGIYKIGMTRRLDPMERVYELGDASVPFRFDVHAMIFSEDAPKLEAALHRAFADKRINQVNLRREYFRVSLDEIKQVVRENHDKTVEFVDVPDAPQYRETIRMQASR